MIMAVLLILMQLMILLACFKLKADRKGREDVEIMVPSKNLSNSLGTLEMPLINCKIKLDLN